MQTSATNAIVALNTAIFVYELVNPKVLYVAGLIPALAFERPRTFFTYAFLHANFLHLFFNMFFLRILGNRLEERIGSISFLISYIALAVAVGVLHSIFVLVFFPSYAYAISIGASGAVMGVLGMSVVHLEGLELRVIIFPIPIPMNLTIKQLALVLLLLETFMAIFNIEPGVAHDAHIMGLLLGYLLARMSIYEPILRPRIGKSRVAVTLFRRKKKPPRYMWEFKPLDYSYIQCLKIFTDLLDKAIKNKLSDRELVQALALCDREFLLELLLEDVRVLRRKDVIALLVTEIFKIILKADETGDLEVRFTRIRSWTSCSSTFRPNAYRPISFG